MQSTSRSGARRRRLPGGRPYKHTVRLSDREQSLIATRAEDAGVTVPRLLVESALARDIPTVSERRALVAEFLGTRRLLASVERNVGQLLATMKAAGKTPIELQATLHAVAQVAARLDSTMAELTGQKPGTRPDMNGEA